MATGWICPACNRSWAPHVDECRGCTASAPPPQAIQDLTFAALWEVFERVRGPELSAWRGTCRVHGLHLLAFFGALRVSEITREKADEYVRLRRTQPVMWIKDPAKQRRVSITTIDHELATLKACFNWCTSERRLISGHLLDGYTVRVLKEDLPTIQDRQFYLPEDGLAKLLMHMPPTGRRLLVLLFQTGMRRDEGRCLERGEVDIEKGIIRLPAWRTKAREARLVPLDEIALHVLRAQLAATEGCKFVFANPLTLEDAPLPKSTIGQQFARARKAAGIKGPRNQDVWIHTLRKSAGTLNAVRTTMPVRMQMEILGHASEQEHHRYIQMGEEHMQSARAFLEQRRRGPMPSPPSDLVKLVKGEDK